MVGPILTIYMSYDVFLPKDVPFGAFLDIAPELGVKYPKTSQKGAWIGIFDQTDKKFKMSYLRSCLRYRNEIVHGDAQRQCAPYQK